VVIAVTTRTTAVVYGTELIPLQFLYVLYLTSAFPMQTNSVPVHTPNSLQGVCCPESQLSLFLVKRTARLLLWSLSAPLMTLPEKLSAGPGSVLPSSCPGWRTHAAGPGCPALAPCRPGTEAGNPPSVSCLTAPGAFSEPLGTAPKNASANRPHAVRCSLADTLEGNSSEKYKQNHTFIYSQD